MRIVWFCLCCWSALAWGLPAPRGEVVLTLEGALHARNHGALAELDLPMLMALPQHEIRTRTPWYDDAHVFRGPRLGDLLALVKAQGTQLVVHALNDYSVTIPIEALITQGAILAHSKDGHRLTVREKGPFFVVFPFDQNLALQTKLYYGWSAWQIDRIRVE